jgi:hypothetical protein
MHDVKVIVNETHIKIMLKNWKRGEKLDYNKDKVDNFLKEIGKIIKLRTGGIRPPYVKSYKCTEFVHASLAGQEPTPDEIAYLVQKYSGDLTSGTANEVKFTDCTPTKSPRLQQIGE